MDLINDACDDTNLDAGDVSSECSMEFDQQVDPYEVLTTEEIVQHMDDCIKEVNKVVAIPATATRILLNHFKWDKDELIQKYYDHEDDQETFFKDAHVVNPFNKPTVMAEPKSSDTSKTEECEICYSDFEPGIMTGLACGHKFCTNCWVEYLTTKIMEEGLGQSISCAAHGCDIIVDDVTVMKLISDASVKLKYQHLITNNFVECNRSLRWCPSAGCNFAIKAVFIPSQPIACTCNCGHIFCFECGDKWHEPSPCMLLKKWKANDISQTFLWLKNFTKECPKCYALIEKNGGCNHMTCKRCSHHFCWMCMGDWASHEHSFRCTRYNGDKAANSSSDSAGKTALARHKHYYDRYLNHMQSLKFESLLHTSIAEKMDEMQQFNMPWIEVQFLKRAVDILCQCRQTLMFTYVFAYYLDKSNQTVIFETNQMDLELATEKLSQYLEHDITSDNLANMKQKVQDKYEYCEQRRKALLKHVHDGNDNDSWTYRNDY